MPTTLGSSRLVEVQSAQICVACVVIGIDPRPAHIGGYRMSSAAQRELQRVTEKGGSSRRIGSRSQGQDPSLPIWQVSVAAGLGAGALRWCCRLGRCGSYAPCGWRLAPGGWAMARRGYFARVLALAAAAGLAGVVQVPLVAAAGSPRAAGPGLDWPQYLGGP